MEVSYRKCKWLDLGKERDQECGVQRGVRQEIGRKHSNQKHRLRKAAISFSSCLMAFKFVITDKTFNVSGLVTDL